MEPNPAARSSPKRKRDVTETAKIVDHCKWQATDDFLAADRGQHARRKPVVVRHQPAPSPALKKRGPRSGQKAGPPHVIDLDDVKLFNGSRGGQVSHLDRFSTEAAFFSTSEGEDPCVSSLE